MMAASCQDFPSLAQSQAAEEMPQMVLTFT